MLVKTPGIVIRNTKYGEGSVISKIYTRAYGMQSFMVNGIYGAKASIKASVLQPLTILDMVIYYHKLKEIQRIKEGRAIPPLHYLHFDVVKGGIAMFISELLNKAIKEEEPNPLLFDFTADYINALDVEQGSLALWPLYFMVQVTNMLGFFPRNDFEPSENPFFDLYEGSFTSTPEHNQYAISMPESQYFSKLIPLNREELATSHFPKPVRAELIKKMILYYKLHLPDFQDIRSFEVLEVLG